MGAVIDSNSFRTQKEAIEEAKADPDSDVLVGGDVADDEGYFVAPTVVETRNPNLASCATSSSARSSRRTCIRTTSGRTRWT